MKKLIVEEILNVYKTTYDGITKKEAREALLHIADKNLLPLLLQKLDNLEAEEADYINLIIEATGKTASPEAFDKLAEIYEKNEKKIDMETQEGKFSQLLETRNVIIKAISNIDNKEVPSFLVKTLYREDMKGYEWLAPTIECYSTLREKATPSIISELLTLLKEKKLAFNNFMLLAEIISSCDGAVKELQSYLSDKDPIISYKGAICLALRGEFHISQLFCISSEDEKEWQYYNRTVLCEKKPEEAMPVLQKILLENKDNTLKKKILEVLLLSWNKKILETTIMILKNNSSEESKIMVADYLKMNYFQKNLQKETEKNPSLSEVYLLLAKFYANSELKMSADNREFARSCMEKYLTFVSSEERKNFSSEDLSRELYTFFSYDREFKITIYPEKILFSDPDGLKIKEIALKEKSFTIEDINYIPRIQDMDIQAINNQFIFAWTRCDVYSLEYILNLETGEGQVYELGNFGITGYRESIEADPVNSKVTIVSEAYGSKNTSYIVWDGSNMTYSI